MRGRRSDVFGGDRSAARGARYLELQALYTEKRTVFLQYLDDAGLSYTRPDGAYYVMVDIGEFKCPDDVVFAEWLARNVGVAGVPGSSFFREPVNHLIRFHFAKRLETLRDAGARLLGLREKARGVTWP